MVTRKRPSGPTVADLKQRVRDAEVEPEAAAPAQPVQPRRASPQTQKMMRAFERESAALNAPDAESDERVELDELPEQFKEEQAQAKAEKDAARRSNVIYSYSAYDHPDVREEIEQRCSELDDFSDLLVTGRVVQEVPIIDERLFVIYQSLIGDESWFSQRMAMRLYTSREEARTWNGYARLALSVQSVNGTEFPPAYNEKRELDEALLEERVQKFLKLPEHLISVLLVNLGWFEDRIQQLFRDDFELLKNG